MPTIPGYQRREQIPGAVQTPRQNFAVSPGALGSNQANLVTGIGREALNIGQVMANQLLEIQKRENEAKAREAITYHVEQTNEYKTGIFDLRGQQALNVTKEAKQDYQTFISSTIDRYKLTGESERIFRERATSLYLSDLNVINRHAATERRRWEGQTAFDSLRAESKALSSMSKSMSFEEIDNYYKSVIMPAAKEASQYSNKSLAEIDADMKNFYMSDTVKQAIISGDVLRARQALDRWSDSIDPDTRNSLLANIRGKELQIESDELASEYINRGDSKTEAKAAINKDIKDDDLRQLTLRKYSALWNDTQAAERQAYIDNTYEYQLKLEEIHREKGISAAQNYLRSLPKTSKIERKIYNQVETLYSQLARGYGIDRQSDAERYLWVSDQIEQGNINNEKELSVLSEGKLTKADLKELTTQLKGTQVVKDSQLKQVYANSLGSSGFALLNKKQKKGWHAFAVWAKDLVKDSNKAKDPEYIQKLSDLYQLEGETKSRLPFTGYGFDKKFHEAVKDDTWIVEIDKDAKSSVALTPKEIPEIMSQLKATGELGRYLQLADGDTELAVRMAYTDRLRRVYVTGTDEERMFDLAKKVMSPSELVAWSSLSKEEKLAEFRRLAGGAR